MIYASGMARPWTQRLARIEDDGWKLESGEARHRAHPDAFWIPPRAARDALRVGQAVKLLFSIEAQDDSSARDRVTERMWAVVAGRVGVLYVGILDDQPAGVAPRWLDEGSEFIFGAEHVIDIDDPPRDYLTKRFGNRLTLDD